MIDRIAAWQKLEQHPGGSATNFDLRRLIVEYGSSAQLPTAWQTSGGPAGPSAAASAPNPSLRRNKQYEPLTDAIAQRFNLTICQQVYRNAVNFASFELPAGSDGNALLAQLRLEGAGVVEHAIFAPRSRQQYIPSDPDMQQGETGPQWSHWRVRCPEAWEVTLGDPSVMVAVVDTGVQIAHEELAAQVIDPAVEFPTAHCDVINNDNTVDDQVGHGTFIAGVICAEAENGRTIAGVAPHCRVIPVKVANAPWTTADNLIAGAYLGADLGARVVNYSWGSYTNFPLEEAMIDELTANGVLFVCAAGNDNTADFMYPAAFTNALAVGATNINDQRAYFSNWGNYVDIAAPGESLASTGVPFPYSYENYGDGTSYAAPMVAAAAGLLWSYKPELSLAEVRDLLVSNGPVMSGFIGDVRRLDIAAALLPLVNPIFPAVDGVSLQPRTTFGELAASTLIDVSLIGATDVKRARYTLDLNPPGPSPNDIIKSIMSGGSSPAQFDVTGQHNQAASLKVEFFSPSGDGGDLTVAPVWIFNQPGDIDGDGIISALDSAMLSLLIGMSSDDINYLPFADSDGDGVVTEADNAVVGYNFGQGLVLPNILTISSTNLWLDEEVTLTASVVGSGTLSYSWDFGGGGTPNTSNLAAPVITPTAAGTFNASLTISSEFGSDYYGFKLNVYEKPPIEIVLEIKPRVGLAPLNSYFDAHKTKSVDNIVKYEWDWDGDDSTWEQETEYHSVYHSFPDLGIYTVNLRVTNSKGLTATASTKIRVVEGVEYGSFGSRDLGPIHVGSNEDNYLEVTEIGGRPAVIWLEKLPVESYNVAVAKVDTPLLSSDWRIDKVFTGTIENLSSPTVGICEVDGEAAFLLAAEGSLRYGRYQGDEFNVHAIPGPARNGRLANIGGKPAVISTYFDELHYIYSTVPNPSSSADWVDVDITVPGIPTGGKTQLLEYAGVPVFQNSDASVTWATAMPPTSTSWETFIFDGGPTGNTQLSLMFDEGTTLGYMFENRPVDDKALRFARLEQFPPTQLSDWQIHEARIPHKPVDAMGSVDGLPSFMTRDGELYLSLDPKPAAVTDWLLVTTPDNFEGIRIVSHGGLPALFDIEGSHLKYRYPLL